MKVNHDKLATVLKKVDLVREQLAATCVGKLEPTLRVMDLKYVVEQMYGLEITMVEASFSAIYLKGHIMRYANNKATVIVRYGLSAAERRWVAIKELCHLIIDEAEDWSTDGAQIVDSLLEESVTWSENGIGLPDPVPSVLSELLAVLAANELAYPGEYRIADQKKLNAEQSTIGGIAIQHDLPPYVIEHALRHHEMIQRVRDGIKP